MKVILITGASRGLGKVMFETFSHNNRYRVYGTSRNPGKTGLLKLDVTDHNSVKNCILKLIEKEGQIDVLINNVGSNLIGSLEGLSLEEFEEELDISFLGTIRMIQEVMPYFRQANSGHIINISSLGGTVTLPYNSTYSGAKSALEAMSESLFYELLSSPINVSVVAPLGLKIEEDIPNLKYIKNEKSWNKPSLDMYKKMIKSVKPSVSKDQVAKKVQYVIESKKPKLKYYVGWQALGIVFVRALLPSRIFYKILKNQLFK